MPASVGPRVGPREVAGADSWERNLIRPSAGLQIPMGKRKLGEGGSGEELKDHSSATEYGVHAY